MSFFFFLVLPSTAAMDNGIAVNIFVIAVLHNYSKIFTINPLGSTYFNIWHPIRTILFCWDFESAISL
jgi:hypothetical protein